MTMSNIPKPEGGFYQVGDVLATKKQAIAFLKAIGWLSFKYFTNDRLLVDCEKDSAKCSITPFCDSLLPYTIKGFLPEHTATATTPNPPLTFEEVIALEQTHKLNEVYLQWNDKLNITLPFQILPSQCGGFYLDDLKSIDCCLRWGGKVYAHDPDVYPPTQKEEG
jgi:hypothetical protein